jgi:hypothetical protein
MRITKNQLRQIIKEELSGVLREQQSPEELSASAASLSLDDLLAMRKQMPDNAALNSEFDSRVADAKRKEAIKSDVAANSPLIQALTKKEDDETQIAKEKPPAKVDESRRRKVRKTRRK